MMNNIWHIEQNTDGSPDWRVVYRDEEQSVILACSTRAAAYRLAVALNRDCAWVETTAQ